MKGELKVGKEVKGGPCTAFSGDPGEGCSSGGLENLSRDHESSPVSTTPDLEKLIE